MKRGVKSVEKIWYFLLYVRRYSVTLLLSMILLSDMVGATPSGRELQIGQQSVTNQLDTKRAAQEAYQEGFKLYQQGTAESLRQAILKLEKALELWRQLNDLAKQALTLNNLGRVYDDLGEKQKALEYYNQALSLERAVGNKSLEATTLNNIGRVYDDLGEKQKALEYYNQALSLERAVGNKSLEATTLNNLGSVYSDLGEKQKALEYFNQVLPLRRAVGDKSGEATTLNNLGKVYSDLGEKQKALEYFNQALPLERAVGNKSGEAITLNNLGKVYSNLGEKQKVLKYFNQALPLERAVGDKSGEAITLNNLGSVYSDLGEKQKALEYFNQVLPLRRAVGDKSGEATTLNNLGKVYSDLGEKQKALVYYNQALPLERAVGNKSGEAITLNNLGKVYSNLGEKQKVLKYFNQALPLERAVGDKSGEAITLNNLGSVYDDLGEKQKALVYYNQALPLERAVGDKSGEASTLNNLGKVYDSLGEKQKALVYYNQALPLERAVGDKSVEATTLNNIAHLERSLGNLEQSLQQIEAAITIIEDLRIKVDNSDLRTSYFASVQDDYKFYIDLLMQLHKKNPSMGYNIKALNASEKSRARGLLELLTEARANIRKGASPKLLNAEKQLTAKIDALEKQRFEIVNSDKINNPISKARAEDLSKQISKSRDEYQQLQDEIKKSNPQYASLKYPEPLTLPQIQQQLDKDTLLLQYSLGKEHSYLWAVSSNSVDSYQLPKQAQIEKAAINLFCLTSHSLSKPPTAPGRENPCKDIETRSVDVAAKELSQMILAPVKDKLGQKRLVIVADGALQYIPFAALAELGGGRGGRNYRGGIFVGRSDVSPSVDSNYEPLLVKHEIINLPSASTIAIQRQQIAQRKKAPKTLAILADPVFSAKDARVTGKPESSQLAPNLELERSALARSANLLNRSAWNRLDGTRAEAESILTLVPSSTERLQVFDFDANYTWATSSALNQFRILHFATHGFVNDENPELSGIVLSLVDKQGKDIQGYLRLNELFNLDYPADLIVLSACETGLGKNIQGEGLVGLTRGLMYAGGERLVVSLWKVDDEGTSMLMQEFYKEMLLNGKSPYVALRAAQLKMWQQEKWRDPNYWAAFTFLGEWR